ncbi:hypothetical protein HNV10_03910 [Winogradskyella litoriviva]|uniref:Uncharacterized protein n=1 Tax=Winogradskyella litoriviva TaxID=1220182 RepID=A0ABX2E2N9_9FLAO|nr:hypothetical protein [Winogradskyella litoriviva]NRD22372.1 hypothetical protein [Winogradskyella litoriviva]
MKLTITFILFFILVSCSNEHELQPKWNLQVTERGKLEINKDKLYLIDESGEFEIDIKTGKKVATTKQTIKYDFKNIGVTGKENNFKKWELTKNEITYSLI